MNGCKQIFGNKAVYVNVLLFFAMLAPVYSGVCFADNYSLNMALSDNVAGSVTGSGLNCPDSTCTVSIDENNTVNLSATASQGWEFSLWSGDTSGFSSTSDPNPTFMMGSANRSVTALFNKITYNLDTEIDESSGCSGNSVTSDTTYTYDQGLAVVASPGVGCEFSQWTGDIANIEDASSASTHIKEPTYGDTDATAVFVYHEYPLSIDIMGLGTVAKSPDKDTYHYRDTVELTATPAINAIFRRWEQDLSGTDLSSSVIIHDGTNEVRAVFGHTVTASAGTGGSVSPNGTTELDYQADQRVVITPQDALHCTEEVLVDGISQNPLPSHVDFARITDNHRVEATFREIYTFTGYVEPSEARLIGRWRLRDGDTGDVLTSWHKHGETVNIPCDVVSVRVEYNSENCGPEEMSVASGNILPAQPMVASQNLTATGTYDVPVYELTLNYTGTGEGTLSASPGGGSCSTDCPETYSYSCNTTVTVRAVPDGVSRFEGWDGSVADPSNSVTTITLFGNQTVTAKFENVQYSLSMGVIGSGTVSPAAGTHLYDPNTTVTLIATPANGWEFVEWQGNVVDTHSQSTTILMTADETVNAVFHAAPSPDVDNDGDGYTENQGDCNDFDNLIHPGAEDICGDGIDQDCNGLDKLCQIDNDGDGFLPDSGDCNDNDSSIHPNAPEICGDGIDQDCDGVDLACNPDDQDNDHDGYSPSSGDCDDGNADIHPGAVDICGDGIDQDCYDGDRECDTADSCVTINDKPLNAQIQAAQANVMFLLDDSGSMDWSILRQNGSTYRGYDYLFDNAGDNAYGPDNSTVMSRSERRDYLSQWNGDNNMYYNPETYYFAWADSSHTWNPSSRDYWPSMADADLDFPRSNPMTSQTLDFRETADVLAASDELIPYMTLWQEGGQRIEVARVQGSTGWRTLADAVRLVHEHAPARVRVSGPNDDAEQNRYGAVILSSGDLDMICDGYEGDLNNSAMGIRFSNVLMPLDWDPVSNPITEAHIVFTASVNDSTDVDLSITGEMSENSAAFTSDPFNVTNRAETSTRVSWNNIQEWTAGNEYQSPDIHELVNSIVSQANWESGNPMTFIIRERSGGCRRAITYNADPSRAPVLVLKTATSDDNAPDIIVDNNDDLFVWQGTSWRGASDYNVYHAHNGRYFYSSIGELPGDSAHRASWLLNIPVSGVYHVYAWVPDRGEDVDSQAPYSVFFNGGSNSATVHMDQRSQTVGGNAAQWYELKKTTEVYYPRSTGATDIVVTPTGYVPDITNHTYTFTIEGHRTVYTLTSGTIENRLYFTPGLERPVSTGAKITFNEWWTFTAPATERSHEVVHRAHYFTKDTSGNVYLVIMDSHDISGSSLGGEVIQYYLWQDANGNQVVDFGELTRSSTPPDEVIPKKNYVSLAVDAALDSTTLTTVEDISSVPVGSTFTLGNGRSTYTVLPGSSGHSLHVSPALLSGAATGTKVKFGDPNVLFERTYQEEKQNFVNWYSFFRRRELTAKAAVGRVIADMSGVKIGIHTIHEQINQEVLQVKPKDWQEQLDASNNPLCTAANNYCDNTDILLDLLYSINSGGGTPLRRGLERVGRYFDDTDGDIGIPGSSGSPYATSSESGACQQSFAIAMTDGYYNGGAPDLDRDGDDETSMNADGDHNTEFDGAPYGDNLGDTLADVAMFFYERDLSSSLANQVPKTSTDQNNAQHMVTYGVAFGVEGALPDSASCPPACTWPTTMNNQGRIDDLYHAAVNGRGTFFTAKDPQELVDALLAIQKDIELKISSGAAVGTTPSGQLSDDTYVFQGLYNPEFWSGDIKAYELYSLEEERADKAKPEDQQQGILAGMVKYPSVWSAEESLQVRRMGASDWWDSNREVITYNGLVGVPFRMPSNPALPAFQEISLAQLGLLGDTTDNRSKMIDYLRGDISNEQPNGEGYRSRGGQILGDIIHSSPVMVETYVQSDGEGDGIDNDNDGDTDEVGEREPLILVGANDGGLHVFNPDDDGEELLFYIPGLVYSDDQAQPHLTKLATPNPNYSHQYYVDGSVYAARLGESISDPVMAIGGLRKGGKGYFLLNVTEISRGPSEDNAENIVIWEYPNNSSYAKNYNPLDSNYLDQVTLEDTKGLMGYSYAQGYIVRSNTDEDNDTDTTEWMAVFGNGYESPSGKAALILLGLDPHGNITWRREIDTGFSGDPLAGQVTAITINNPGSGYQVGDPVTLTGGRGSGATAHVATVYDSNGLAGATLVSGGSGYSAGEILNISGGSGTGATISVDTVDTNGGILTWSIISPGNDYSIGDTIDFGASAGGGSGATATITSTETGSIGTIAIDAGGSGYDGTETVDFSGGNGSGATADFIVGDSAARCNGLSSTALVDVNFDGKVDYAYAGDLYGNMWKFDLRSSNPANWQIAYCDGGMGGSFDPDNPDQAYGCMENYPGVVPHPLVTVQYNQMRHTASGDSWESTMQPITIEPDVIVPCALGQKGYLVLFGTGRYISDNEINDKSGQAIYGIWDWAEEWIDSGIDSEPYDKYLGSLELPVSPESGLGSPYPALIRKLSNTTSLQVTREIPQTVPPVSVAGTGVTLLEQVQISGATDINSAVYRVLSNFETNWYSPEDQEGEHVGWFFNLPGRGERVVTGLAVRDGILDVISTQPSPSPCSGGIVSIIHGIDACNGGRPNYPYFDVNGDGVIDSNDMINIGSEASPKYVAPTGLYRQGMLYSSSSLSINGTGVAAQVRSASTATLVVTRSRDERKGLVFWREIE